LASSTLWRWRVTREVVAAQLRARPDLHRYNAASVVREAIAVEFPCV